jgi:hypothetical protein
MKMLDFSEVENKVLQLRNQNVILDRDVAALYGVQTREINQAVKNNPDKFPSGYIITLTTSEFRTNRSKILTGSPESIVDDGWKHSTAIPKAFTEKGLYMLATILKSPQATQTTLAIVEVFAQIRELARTVAALSETSEGSEQKALMEKGGGILSDLLGDDLRTTDTETSFEVNFAMLKVKHTIKRKENK